MTTTTTKSKVSVFCHFNNSPPAVWSLGTRFPPRLRFFSSRNLSPHPPPHKEQQLQSLSMLMMLSLCVPVRVRAHVDNSSALIQT